MANFSEYGGYSDEFRALWESQAPKTRPDSIEELKRATNADREKASAEAFGALAASLIVKDYAIPTRDGSTLQARSYRARASSDDALPLYLHLHGGGYLFGTLDSEDAACARIAVAAPVVVLNINYRHTPEHVFPTQHHDVEDAFEWAHRNASGMQARPDAIILGGISAGSQLATALAQTKKREGAASLASIIGQVLMIPAVVATPCYAPQLTKMESPAVSSYPENEFAPVMPRTVLDLFNKLIYPVDPDIDDRKASPGNATPEEIRHLPPTVFGIAGLDILRDEGLLYAKLLAENG